MKTLLRAASVASALVILASGALAQNRPPRFWNLTRNTISEFYLAPAGTANWSDNQCKNDKDGTVDSDERLRITGINPGTYDAKLKDTTGPRIEGEDPDIAGIIPGPQPLPAQWYEAPASLEMSEER